MSACILIRNWQDSALNWNPEKYVWKQWFDLNAINVNGVYCVCPMNNSWIQSLLHG